MGLFDFLFRKKVNNKDISAYNYEFCPRCEANLTLQKGYNNELSYWVCKGCGEMLINPRIKTYTDIVWICDECESMLNEQPGFTEDCGKWKCTECGFVNTIDDGALYLSDEEYQVDLHNPYKGMSDADVLEITSYEEIDYIKDREDIIVVSDENGKKYVKKFLRTYDESVYKYLIEHPIAHMPKIFQAYKSDKYLIIIEEYIEGITLSDMLKEREIDSYYAVKIAKSLCAILKELHSLKRPIIHRDIKPSNVMINAEGEVILLDVNVAKWYKAEEIEDTRLLGTLYFAAPEQFGYGLYASTEKTDIYAVGVLLNIMITGKLPKEKKAPDRIWDIIKKCICLEPDERYSDDELLEAMNNYMR